MLNKVILSSRRLGSASDSDKCLLFSFSMASARDQRLAVSVPKAFNNPFLSLVAEQYVHFQLCAGRGVIA